jgi:hypothetical protein
VGGRIREDSPYPDYTAPTPGTTHQFYYEGLDQL